MASDSSTLAVVTFIMPLDQSESRISPSYVVPLREHFI